MNFDAFGERRLTTCLNFTKNVIRNTLCFVVRSKVNELGITVAVGHREEETCEAAVEVEDIEVLSEVGKFRLDQTLQP